MTTYYVAGTALDGTRKVDCFADAAEAFQFAAKWQGQPLEGRGYAVAFLAQDIPLNIPEAEAALSHSEEMAKIFDGK